MSAEGTSDRGGTASNNWTRCSREWQPNNSDDVLFMTDKYNIDRDWFRKWFNREYLQLYGHRDQSEADSFIDYLLESGWIRAGDRVLDAGCGAGRHLKSMLGKGVDVNGIDLSPDLLTESRKQHGESLTRRVVRGDVRFLPFKRGFDSILSLFTGFGYFSEAENADLVKVFHSVLKPGGRILIDVFNARKTIANLEKYSKKTVENLVVEEYRDFCREENRINKRIVITNRPGRLRSQRCPPQRMKIHGSQSGSNSIFRVNNGNKKEYFESVRCYGIEDFQSLFGSAGFQFIKAAGDYSGQEFNDDSERLIIMGERK